MAERLCFKLMMWKEKCVPVIIGTVSANDAPQSDDIIVA